MKDFKDSHLIILPGNGSVNKEWSENIHRYFLPDFKSVLVQNYDHWSNGGELIDMEVEAKKFTETVNSLSGKIVILAKSIGTVLVMYAVHSKSIPAECIEKCVFLGLPPEWARKNGFDIDAWSSDYSIPTTLIQNTDDPVATVNDIKGEKMLGKFQNLTLVEHIGDDHVYNDLPYIRKYLIG